MTYQKLVLSDSDFQFFRELIFSLAGINLNESKKDLVCARLSMYISELGYTSFTDYRKFLKAQKPGGPEFQNFINLLTTNKTDFFREPPHFDFLVKTFLPQWLKTGQKKLNVWSCAASTGEEIYTLSMVLRHHLPDGFDFKILATDIDTDVLTKAKNAVYPIDKLVEIPLNYQKGSVAVGTGEVAKWFKIKNELKEKVLFKQHNLLLDKESSGVEFDMVFCRNVLIYFTKETIEQVVNQLFLSTKVGGLLFIGHSESLNGLKTNWKNVQPSIYKRH